jgi:hypothetical protein
MTYKIRTHSGTIEVGTIIDGTYDDTTTSLVLVGRNYANYGQIMLDNTIKLLENFAYEISPSNPLSGQLWWSTGDTRLRVYTGSQWKIISSATAQNEAPSTTIAGDIWWDTDDEQCYIYNGTSPYNLAGWILVGPAYSKKYGKSGAIWEQILDTLNQTHDVLSMFLDGVRTAIISRDTAFTINATVISNYPGFELIDQGYNMCATGTVGTIWGTANNASYLGTVPAANYLRTDIDNRSTGNLRIVNDAGIRLGLGLDLELSVTSDINAQIINRTDGGSLSMYVNPTGGGSTLVRSIYINGSNGQVEVAQDPTTILGVATKQYVDNKFTNTQLFGIPVADTAPAETATRQLATTEFVLNRSGFLKNKIYQGNSYMQILDAGTGGAELNVDGQTVLAATASGVSLNNGATAITQTQAYNSTGNARVATTQFVRTANQWWGTSAKFVSVEAPNAGVNDTGSHDGDFWFQLSF